MDRSEQSEMKHMDKNGAQNGKARWAEVSASQAWWLAATAIAAALVLGLGALIAIRLLALPLALLTLALTLAAALDPIVAWLERRMARPLAAILVYLLVILLLTGLLWTVIPSLVEQVQSLGSRIPELIEQAREFLERWEGSLSGDSLVNAALSQLSRLGPALLRLPLAITSILSGILLILFISFYILLETSQIQDFLLSLFPEKRSAHINRVIAAMAQAMGGYFRGAIINGVIVGFLTFLGLLIVGIDYPIAFGVLAGLLEVIPVAGPIIAGFIIVGLTLIQDPGKALAVLIFMVVLQQLENNILVPNIMRDQTKVSPLLAILALFAGGAIGGLMGALVAIPLAAALRVLFVRVIAPAIRRQTGAEPLQRDSG